MKKRVLTPLFALLISGSMLLLSACSVDFTSINEEETTISAEREERNLIDGTLTLHGVLYDAGGNPISGSTVTVYNGNSILFSGVTDETGSLEECFLPCNTTLYCTVANSAGTVIAEGNLIFKLSDEYSHLTIYPPEDTEDEEIAECTMEIPTSKTNVRGAFFVTDSGTICFVSLTPYEDSEVYPEEAVEESDAEESEPSDETPVEETNDTTED